MPGSPFKLSICHMSQAARAKSPCTKAVRDQRAKSSCGKAGKTARCSKKHKGMAYCVKKSPKKKSGK